MSILRRLVTLPLAPVESVIWVAEQIERQAADQLYGPSVVRRELAELNAAYEGGELSDEDFADQESILLDRLQVGLSHEETQSHGF